MAGFSSLRELLHTVQRGTPEPQAHPVSLHRRIDPPEKIIPIRVRVAVQSAFIDFQEGRALMPLCMLNGRSKLPKPLPVSPEE